MDTVTYSPEDNKIRLYVGRVPRDEYERLRAAGFVSTPKQDCDFVATWTPHREDIASEYLADDEDIGDEDYSCMERSADRAERFDGYREKRIDEATDSADAFASGPQAFGNQDRGRTERQAKRHDRHRLHACSQWSKAEYWQQRTQAVIGHALYKSSASVRRGRILTLEAEQRKHEKSREEYATRFAAWSKVGDMDGADMPITNDDGGGWMPAQKLAYMLANSPSCGFDYVHPRTGQKTSLYSMMTDPQDKITPREASIIWLEGKRNPDDEDGHSARWSRHYQLRLDYENAMLGAEGGRASDADMEPGGWIGKYQIQAVNRSPVTKRIVSVKIIAPPRWGGGPDVMQSFNIERLPEGAYRAPTDEERQLFAVNTAARKAEEKAKKPKEPSLINPNDEDAERLQEFWNKLAKDQHRLLSDYKPVEVARMTQAEYSQRSKGSYSTCETRTIHEGCLPSRRVTGMYSSEGQRYDAKLGAAVCKIRVKGYSPLQVIVITDKPQKPLGLDWSHAGKLQESEVVT